MKTYTEKRFFEWHEDEVSVTIRNKGGSYGGGVRGVYPIILRDDITLKYDDQGIAFSLDTMHRQQVIMQQTTGTLSPGAHPGSYNGQDAYSDLLICSRKRSDASGAADGQGWRAELHARPTDDFEGGGIT